MSDPNPTVDLPGPEAAPPVPADSTPQPERIGRYRIEGVLGQGNFGLVYLAHDGQLKRQVAIKVPHARLVAEVGDAEAYLTEARTVAGLDHPNIVPVYDVGSTEDCPCFVVSKFIEGSTLAQRIKANRPSVAKAVQLVATVAETLHYAHRKGLVHRDIKPGNILLVPLCPSFPLIKPLGRQPLTCFPMVEPGLLIPPEPTGHGPTDTLLAIAPQRPPQQPRHTPTYLRDRQRRCVVFSPAASPASKTTSPPRTTLGGGASPPTSAPGSRPSPPPPWPAAGPPRSGAPP
jgi:serine/threonine protein kinase